MMKQSTINYLGNGSLGAPAISNNGLSDVINSEFATVKIIERFPKSGQPSQGVPFSVKVEVQTYATGADFWRVPFKCLDAFVVARGLYQHQNKILASSFVRTNAFSNCRGTATLTFDPEFRASATDWVQFEVYKGGTSELFEDKTTLQIVKNGDADLVGTSEPMRFNASQKQLINAGVIEEESGSLIGNSITGIAGGLRENIGAITTLIAVGAGSYLVWKNGDAIKEFISDKVNAAHPSNLKKKLKQ